MMGSSCGKLLWEAHFAGIEREYCQIEKLANHLSSPCGPTGHGRPERVLAVAERA
jgi:hypothetical protein